MVKRKQYQAYMSATYTVAKTKQVVMLYDGVIRFVRQAKDAIEAKRIEDRYNLLLKASEIITGLQGALDFEEGGEVAAILYNYYSSIDSRLFSIQRSNSLQTCDEVIADLKEMRDVWLAIDNSQSDGTGPAPSQPSSGKGPEVPPSGITVSA